MQELKEWSRVSSVIRQVFKILIIQTVPKAVPHKLQIIQVLNSWDLNNPMGKWPNGETCPKGETAQRGKCGSTLEND